MTETPRVLLVGSTSSGLPDVARLATEEGIGIELADSPVDAMKQLDQAPFDFVMIQARLEGTSGLTITRRARSRNPGATILLIGPPVSLGRRTDILASGVDDYLEMPISSEQLLHRIQQMLAAKRMDDETGLLGRSPRMLQVFETIRQVAATRITVLIAGESGTGKEVVAHAIHRMSSRSDGPFVAVNCGAIPEGLLESDLFGHEKGAFTGAATRHAGRFEQADGGSLLLDEIGETPLNLQVKLLRALEDQAYYRVGGSQLIRSDVRLIAATNRNLEEAVSQGTFRRDLYFRLKVVSLLLPPIRERREDIPLLVDRFLTEASARHGSPRKSFSPEAMELLVQNEWPGNVREIKNLIESLTVLVKHTLVTVDDVAPHLTVRAEVHRNLPVSLSSAKDDAEREIIYRTLLALRSELAELKSILLGALRGVPVEPSETGPAPPRTLDEAESRMIDEAIRKTSGNRRKAAKLLGISERTLYRRLKKQQSRP
ncbi:MAG: sigma-54-dependent Fis family transcriptional regulator [Candidatus Eisenbacteria sp.]|nr:sigma-54-dependent Fis family transcriptional regulator [Candidatus Eisenbacteria bacterium]